MLFQLVNALARTAAVLGCYSLDSKRLKKGTRDIQIRRQNNEN